MQKIRIEAPAKINFGLRILSKRTDGFHNLETLFYPINDLTDIITIERSEITEFNSNAKELTTDPGNLILRAKTLIEERAGVEIYANFFLDKRIPIGAGLGGGSSDAAAALYGLNKLFNLSLSDNALFDIALKLGSDVPFFLNPVPSIGTSRGEILDSINLKIKKPIVLINPCIHISTAEIFSKVIPLDQSTEYRRLIRNDEINYKLSRSSVINDFEKFIFSKYPEVKEIKAQLYASGADFALMTGTGSTVFGIFPDVRTAEKCIKYFPEQYFKFISGA